MEGPNKHPRSHDQCWIHSRNTGSVTHDQLAVLIIYRPLLAHLSKCLNFSADSCTNFVAANLIVEECISDIFRNFGHSQNVVLTFDASLGADTIVERVSVIPNQLESAWRKSALQWIKPDSNYSLKQLRSALALVLIPHRVFAVL